MLDTRLRIITILFQTALDCYMFFLPLLPSSLSSLLLLPSLSLSSSPPSFLQASHCDDGLPSSEQSHRVLVHGGLCPTQLPWHET